MKMLTFIYTKTINFIALTTAEATEDNNDILGRIYNNNVELYYTIDKKSHIIHILYIESHNEHQGNASNVINDFVKEYSEYNIIIDALFYLEEWYKSLNFITEYAIDDMMCFRMKLGR